MKSLLKNSIRFAPVLALTLMISCTQKPEKQATASGTLPPPPISTISAEDKAKFQRAIQAYIDSSFPSGRLNGSILVAKNGEILYEHYAGFNNPRRKEDSITQNTPFHLASVSKTVTAVAILKLWQDGKLNIQDSITKYLPGFPSEGVTIKTLLNHRSGLPNYVHYMERLGWNRNQIMTNQDVLDFLIEKHDDIDIGPADRRFTYSNTNYALLALIIEKASGMSYGDYMKTTFFDPLGMTSSYVYKSQDSARSLPSFFNNGRQYAFDYLDMVYGDKNIYSTVRDMLKFDQALNSGKLLNTDVLTQSYTPYSFEKPGKNNYGLGWRMILLANGKKLIYHNGWWHGYRTAFYRMPDENAVIIALCNNDSRMIYSTKKLADLFGDYMQTNDKDDDLDNGQVRRKSSRRSSYASTRKMSRSKYAAAKK